MNTKIEWTDAVWNPVTGCTKVSAGCAHCYAERMAKRLAGRAGYPAAPHQFDVTLHPERLVQPLRWKKPRRVFVNSMSDLFHRDVPFEFILQVWVAMAVTPQHTYQILTKRADRMQLFISEWLPGAWGLALKTLKPLDTPLPNVWLGVSAENQKAADERIPWLLKTPAAVRFVSCEPLLGKVNIYDQLGSEYDHRGTYGFYQAIGWENKSILITPGIDWVICGGESGPGARPMHPDWARSLRDQCQAADTPFFFKQWGEWVPIAAQYDDEDPNSLDKVMECSNYVCLGNMGTLFSSEIDGEVWFCGYQPVPWENPWFLERIDKRSAGRLLDGREWSEFPG